MATIEKRVQDLEFIVGHLPEDLDARFAGVDHKLAGIRETQAGHSQRFTRLDEKLAAISAQLTRILERLD